MIHCTHQSIDSLVMVWLTAQYDLWHQSWHDMIWSNQSSLSMTIIQSTCVDTMPFDGCVMLSIESSISSISSDLLNDSTKMFIKPTSNKLTVQTIDNCRMRNHIHLVWCIQTTHIVQHWHHSHIHYPTDWPIHTNILCMAQCLNGMNHQLIVGWKTIDCQSWHLMKTMSCHGKQIDTTLSSTNQTTSAIDQYCEAGMNWWHCMTRIFNILWFLSSLTAISLIDIPTISTVDSSPFRQNSISMKERLLLWKNLLSSLIANPLLTLIYQRMLIQQIFTNSQTTRRKTKNESSLDSSTDTITNDSDIYNSDGNISIR